MISRKNKKRINVLAGLLIAGVVAMSLPLFAAHTAGAAEKGKKADSQTQKDKDKDKIPFPKPLSHNGNWIEYHGRSVEPSANTALAADNNCLSCHDKSDCISCHNTLAPRDHNNTWRTLSHGFAAEGNRERCQNCHKQDFCVRCHNETAPRSHNGGWGNPGNRHCNNCHPGSNNVCRTCHKALPGFHTWAPSL